MFEQIFINALISGSTYSLVGMSFGLIFSTSKFFHMAHGGIITLAGYLAYVMISTLKLNPGLSIFSSILLILILAWTMETLVFRQIRYSKSSSTIQLIASLGILVVIQNLISMLFGDDVRVLSSEVSLESIQFFSARITHIQALIIISNMTILLLISYLLNQTLIGRKIRAITDNAELAKIFGVSVDGVITQTFAFGSALAGLVGILISYDVGLTPLLGYHTLFMGVVAAICGGITSPIGTFLAGLTLAVILQVSGWFFPTQWQDAIAFSIFIIFLILRPQDFFGKPLKSAKV